LLLSAAALTIACAASRNALLCQLNSYLGQKEGAASLHDIYG
jgi:hypothetical protein